MKDTHIITQTSIVSRLKFPSHGYQHNIKLVHQVYNARGHLYQLIAMDGKQVSMSWVDILLATSGVQWKRPWEGSPLIVYVANALLHQWLPSVHDLKINFLNKITLGKLSLMCFIQNGNAWIKEVTSFQSLPHPSHCLTQSCQIYWAIHLLAVAQQRETASSKPSSEFLFWF